MTTPRPHAELAARQSVTDELRLAAKSAAPYGTAMIGASHLSHAADTIDTLRAQIAEAQKDSDRLDWIEQNANMGVVINRLKLITDLSRLVYEVAVDDVYATEDTLRAAIDTANTNELTEQSEKQQATMSLAELDMRDYFAAQAIGPLLQQTETYTHENWRLGIAIDAYSMADAMLAARERAPL